MIALVLDAPPRDVAAWMTLGLAVWTVILVVASVLGFGLFGIV